MKHTKYTSLHTTLRNSLNWLQSGLLLGGVGVAYWTIYHDFLRFFEAGYGITRFTNCLVPNPLSTPCFYGGIAFTIAFVWSLCILLAQPASNSTRHQRGLWWLLLGGTIFAWSNFGYQLYRFIENNLQPTVGCSAVLIENPFATSCFYGASLFLFSFIVASILKYKK